MKKKANKHFSAEEWVNFVMELTSQMQKAEMQAHLDSGCRKCSDLAGLWTRVGEVAKREASLEPPTSAVQHVRRSFSLLAESHSAQRRTLIPRLVFDSLWQPALAGVRSASASPRQVIYKAREVSIEMHIEAESKSERVNLTGQLSLGSLQGQSMPAIPVIVSGARGRVAATSTNGFGEFHLTFVPEDDLQISFGIIGGEEVVIPLGGSGLRIFFRK